MLKLHLIQLLESDKLLDVIEKLKENSQHLSINNLHDLVVQESLVREHEQKRIGKTYTLSAKKTECLKIKNALKKIIDSIDPSIPITPIKKWKLNKWVKIISILAGIIGITTGIYSLFASQKPKFENYSIENQNSNLQNVDIQGDSNEVININTLNNNLNNSNSTVINNPSSDEANSVQFNNSVINGPAIKENEGEIEINYTNK